MAAELQQLLEKIQKDGVDKANAEANRILAEAKAKAESIVKDAEAKAEAAEAKAKADSDAYTKRAEETIRQAARDTLIEVRNSVTAMLEAILSRNVAAALSDPATVAPIAAAAVKEIAAGGEAEVSAGAKLVEAIKAQLAASAAKGVTVVTDESAGTGFSVKLDNGRVEHAFTEDAVAAELAKRLRPELAALVK